MPEIISTDEHNQPVTLPIIDVTEIRSPSSPQAHEQVVKQIGAACEKYGFFYIANHGIDEKLVDKLMSEGREFFGKPLEYKNKYHMKNSRVYRGFFELGGGLC